MNRSSLAALAAMATVGVAAAPANASSSKLEVKYSGLYHAVKAEHGDRAPGRNIRKSGVRVKWVSKDGTRSHWVARKATTRELATSIRQLRQLRQPSVKATFPRRAPAGVMTASVAFHGPASIIACESGGSLTVVNTRNPDRPAGKYQIITSTWEANGGTQFAPTADQASEAEQTIVANRIYDSSGGSQWECK